MQTRAGLACTLAFGLAACAPGPDFEPIVAGGDAQRGRVALEHYECGVCHVIPGVRGARGQVGPSLEDYRLRVYVAGKYPNMPDMLVQWIRDAPALAPESAMPDVGVSEQEARDMAAYLYAQR